MTESQERHTGGASAADEEAVLRAVERLALLFADSDMPRMAARVFAFALIDDAERYTANELAEGLRVSPAAISGAVRQLVDRGLLGKEREPGSRSDQYRIYDADIWSAIMLQQEPAMRRAEESVAETIAILGPHEPGRRRLRETKEFFAFVRADLPAFAQRWHEHRAKFLAEEEYSD